MGKKLEVIDGKQTNWGGLWWHPEYCGFSSASISLSELKKFKGHVRLYVRKNKFFNNGEGNRPNYHFCLKDANAEVFHILEVEDEPAIAKQDEDGTWYINNGERLYTRDEVRKIIDGTFYDTRMGVGDPWDILPEDFV